VAPREGLPCRELRLPWRGWRAATAMGGAARWCGRWRLAETRSEVSESGVGGDEAARKRRGGGGDQANKAANLRSGEAARLWLRRYKRYR
jgi:hypothetical protein